MNRSLVQKLAKEVLDDDLDMLVISDSSVELFCQTVQIALQIQALRNETNALSSGKYERPK